MKSALVLLTLFVGVAVGMPMGEYLGDHIYFNAPGAEYAYNNMGQLSITQIHLDNDTLNLIADELYTEHGIIYIENYGKVVTRP